MVSRNLGRGGLIIGYSKIFCDFGSPIGVKELFESPTYRWQRYSITYTYYWNKYSVKITYNRSLVVTDDDPYDINYTVGNLPLHNTRTNRVYTDYIVDPETGFFTYNQSSYEEIIIKRNSSDTGYDREGYDGVCYLIGNDPTDYYPSEDKILVANTAYYMTSASDIRIIYAADYEAEAGYGEGAGDIKQQDITSNTSSAYPSNGKHSDGYWYIKQSKVDRARGNLIDTVSSKVETQYPENGYLGSYWYVRTS